MKALSLLRPWGMAVIYHGKDIENRTWEPQSLKPGDRFAIHNANRIDPQGIVRVLDILRGTRTAFGMDKDALCGPPGEIIGTVRFVGLVRGSSSTWFDGPIGWILADPRPVRERFVVRGQQRLWDIPEGIEELICAAL